MISGLFNEEEAVNINCVNIPLCFTRLLLSVKKKEETPLNRLVQRIFLH